MCSGLDQQKNLFISRPRSSVVDHSKAVHTEDLVKIFNQSFQASDNTCLVEGSEEPIYLPVDEQCNFNQVIFAHGFFSSALHEIAHWCVAGLKRRQLVDYGYWYAPDGRTAQQQKAFEIVEVMPQALEWIFTKACDARFVVSVDNLSGEETDSDPFKRAVYQRVIDYCESGLSGRAALFHRRLANFYNTSELLSADCFHLSDLSL